MLGRRTRGLRRSAARERGGSLRRWGPLGLEESDETSVEGLRGALRHLRRSPFSRWLVLSALEWCWPSS